VKTEKGENGQEDIKSRTLANKIKKGNKKSQKKSSTTEFMITREKKGKLGEAETVQYLRQAPNVAEHLLQLGSKAGGA
jgi:hypothetical protein